MKVSSNPRAVFNVRETAEHMGIGLNKAYELVNRADFPSIRLGKRIVVPIDALNEWLKAQALSGKEL